MAEALDPREYEIFQKWLADTKPAQAIFLMPRNDARIREHTYYKEFAKALPGATKGVTRRTAAILGPELPRWATVGGETKEQRAAALRATEAVGKPPTPGVPEWQRQAIETPQGFGTYEEARDRAEGLLQAGEDYRIQRNPFGRWDFEIIRPQQAPQPTTYPQPTTPTGAGGVAPQDRTGQFGRTATWNERTGQWQYPPQWGVDPATLQAGYISPAEQQRFGLQQQQFEFQQQQAGTAQEQFKQQLAFQEEQVRAQQEEAERRYTSQLAAQPLSWLEYASYTGQQPMVQPWMVPIGQERGLQAGQPIPGWQPEGMGKLPELQRPSRQLQAQWGPTAGAQYAGYQQARTGATPEETQFRLGSATAPGGSFPRLRWMR